MMNNTLTDLGLTINSFGSFEQGSSSKNSYTLDDGAYDAIVRGYVIKEHVYEGNNFGPKIQLIWQIQDSTGMVHTLTGSRWKLSADERSKFRIEISKWFGKSDWPTVVDILMRGGIITKNADNSATFDISKFIGKRGKLLVTKKASKNGREYNDIMSISPADKNVTEIKLDDIPEFIIADALKYELADNVGIRRKNVNDTGAQQGVPQPYGAQQGVPQPYGVAGVPQPYGAQQGVPQPYGVAGVPQPQPIVDDNDELPF